MKKSKTKINHDPLLLFNMGNDLFKSGDIARAKENFQIAVSVPCEQKLAAGCFNMIGVCEMYQNKFGTAYDSFHQAVQLQPSESSYWMHMGQAAQRIGSDKAADAYSLKAIELDPRNRKALFGRGFVLKEQKRYSESIDCFVAGNDIFQDAESLFYLADILQWAGRDDESIETYERVFRLDPDCYDAHFAITFLYMKLWWKRSDTKYLQDAMRHAELGRNSKTNGHLSRYNLSILQMMFGNYTDGWRNHEARLDFCETPSGRALIATRGNLPMMSPKGNNGVSIVHTEQGFGDTFQFCRYLSILPKDTIFEVPSNMVSIMRHNFPENAVVERSKDYPALPVSVAADTHAPLMSLPYITGVNIHQPGNYLSAPDFHRGKWSFIKNLRGKKIGVLWAGENRKHDDILSAIDSRRSIPFDVFKPIVEHDERALFVCLQLNGVPGDFPGYVPNGIKEWSDTAGIIEHLDLIISVDTAVMHLAAAMGKPTWMLNRFDTCWRWGSGEGETPWYPSLRMFRQERAGDWSAVIERIKQELNVFLAKE